MIIGSGPAGDALRAYLEAFNSGDPDRIQQAITDRFAPSALRGQTPQSRARWDAFLFHSTGGLNLIDVALEGQRVAAHAQSKLADEWFALRLEVADEPPHPITALTLRPSPRPPSQGRMPSLPLESVLARLRALLEKLAAADRFSGVVMVAHEGQPVFEFVRGQANQADAIPNRLDTKFNVGSLAKTFTAVAIAQFAEQGRLAFEDALSAHLPDYPRPVADAVTLHQLLTHTSGLGDYFNAKFEAARAKLRAVPDYIPLFVDEPLAFRPGDRWRYSNAGYILLGAVIERVSGQSYFDYIQEHVFSPAKMPDSGFFEMDRSTPNLALGYTMTGLDGLFEAGPRRNNLFIHVVKGGPAGGAFSTGPDLLNFAQALQTRQLLSPAMTERLVEGKVMMGGAEERQYAYGLMAATVEGKRIVGHSGTFPGIGARLDIYLDDGFVVVILSNYDPPIAQAVGAKLREWLAGY